MNQHPHFPGMENHGILINKGTEMEPVEDTEMGHLVEEITAVGSGDHHTFGGSWTGGYALQQNPIEFALLLKALKEFSPNPKTYLGVGTAAGGSERYIAEYLGLKEMTIIDLGQHEQFPTWRNVNRPALEAQGVKVSEYLGDSHDDAADRFLAAAGTKYDIIGIDGDHTPMGVRLDWLLVCPYLKKGTIIWFHDTAAERMRACDNGPFEMAEHLKKRIELVMETKLDFGISVFRVP